MRLIVIIISRFIWKSGKRIGKFNSLKCQIITVGVEKGFTISGRSIIRIKVSAKKSTLFTSLQGQLGVYQKCSPTQTHPTHRIWTWSNSKSQLQHKDQSLSLHCYLTFRPDPLFRISIDSSSKVSTHSKLYVNSLKISVEKCF